MMIIRRFPNALILEGKMAEICALLQRLGRKYTKISELIPTHLREIETGE